MSELDIQGRANASQARNSASPESSTPNWIGEIGENISNVGSRAKDAFVENLQESQFGKFLRATGILGALQTEDFDFGEATWNQNSNSPGDWRVRLSLPSNFTNSPVLSPLNRTNGLIWPYTPQIYVTHSASYSPIKPIHSNYPFFAYQNSQVDQLVITGQFYNQNSIEARYWIACLHYLRSVTKMEYGLGSTNPGAPPPIVKLNGYGEYVFKDTPVIITNFTVDMPNEVDYVATGIVGEQGEPKIDYSDFASAKATQTGNQMDITWAPAESQFTVTCQPIYSRDKVEKFNYQSFVNGEGIKGGYV